MIYCANPNTSIPLSLSLSHTHTLTHALLSLTHSFFAASHGHHAAPNKKTAGKHSNSSNSGQNGNVDNNSNKGSISSDQAKLNAKREKRTRGSRNTLPPRLFIAGEFLLNIGANNGAEDDDFALTTTATDGDTKGLAEEDDFRIDDNGEHGNHQNNRESNRIMGAQQQQQQQQSPQLKFNTPGRRRLAALMRRSNQRNGGDSTQTEYLFGNTSSQTKQTRNYGVHTYSMDFVRKGQDDMCIPECRLDGHEHPITTMSYGPYNNGPLTTMCEGGFIKVWGGGVISERRSSPIPYMNKNDRRNHNVGGTEEGQSEKSGNAQIILDNIAFVEPTDVLKYGPSDQPISIYASAVQPNDHVWTAGHGHLKAWPLA